MSGENDKPNQNDSSAGKAPEGGNLSSFLKDKAPTMSRILQEEERRAAALAAGDGSDEPVLEFAEDATEGVENDPFVLVEEERFDISFDHLGEDDSEGAGDDGDDDLGPPLPDPSAPATDTSSSEVHKGEADMGDGKTGETSAADSDPTETVDETAAPAEELSNDTPGNAQPLNLTELEEGLDIEPSAPDDSATVEQAAQDDAEEDFPDIEMVNIDDAPAEKAEPEAGPESEPADEFAAWDADDEDDDLGPPLPDLSAPDENDIEDDVIASNGDDWPDTEDLPEPETAGLAKGAAEADLDEEEEEEELTLEIEGLEFQPGDTVAEAAEDLPEANAPGPEPTNGPQHSPSPVPDPAPGIAEPAKPISVQEALMGAIELHRIGDLEGAARGYEALVRRFPNSTAGWINLGIVLRRLGRLDAALACLRRGVMLNPKDGAAWSNLGNALRAANYLEDAKRAQQKALSLTPGAAQIHYNMGLVTRDFGDLVEADACFRRAELLGYDNPDLPWDQSLTMLLSGNLEAGFKAYEARWNLPETQQRHADLPRWLGEPEKDKTLVIHAEQGLGDSLQFCRYVPALKSRVGRLIFEVQPQLTDLLKVSPLFNGVEIRVRSHETIEADMQMPLLSAPNLLPLGESVLPGREPYLTPPPDGPRIGDSGTGPRIGIAWAGKPSHKNDPNRSAGLRAFTALFDLLHARFYSLQVGPAQAEIRDLALGAVIHDLSPAIRSFADTASLLQDLDLIVTVDTSVAHLAGAMGKPVWVMLPFAPDWRWQLHRQDSPWYPSMRLFRQTKPGDWDEVFMRVRAGLDDWIIERDGADGVDKT
jgi:tetratricopeptide (TPR) repeat protein